jgi:hypothetical protein
VLGKKREDINKYLVKGKWFKFNDFTFNSNGSGTLWMISSLAPQKYTYWNVRYCYLPFHRWLIQTTTTTTTFFLSHYSAEWFFLKNCKKINFKFMSKITIFIFVHSFTHLPAMCHNFLFWILILVKKSAWHHTKMSGMRERKMVF